MPALLVNIIAGPGVVFTVFSDTVTSVVQGFAITTAYDVPVVEEFVLIAMMTRSI